MTSSQIRRLYPKGTYSTNTLNQPGGKVEHYATVQLGPSEIAAQVRASQVQLICKEEKLVQVLFVPATKGFTGFPTFTPDEVEKLHAYLTKEAKGPGAGGYGGWRWEGGASQGRIELTTSTLYVNAPGSKEHPIPSR